MAVFSKDLDNCVVLMYPTGGYGNFLYYLLSIHLSNTVNLNFENFAFGTDGNSHNFPKYAEIFDLSKKNLKEFKYTYTIADECVSQIINGKKFLVLADVSNLGDNVNFLKKYFTQAKIIRTYAKSFEEKFLVWYNCISKTSISEKIYKDSLHTKTGIAEFSNKKECEITDLDAIKCDLSFFKNNFAPFGNFFNQPVDGAINIPIDNFFNTEGVIGMCQLIAKELDTHVINLDQLRCTADKFISLQSGLDLLKNYNNKTSLAAQALKQWYETY